MMNKKRLLTMAVSAALAAPMSAFATNGMLLEGYGPIATGMGGASMAYDNGTAGMMNNPATLALMKEGSRLDLALGHMAPDVTFEMMGQEHKSKSDSFLMPALGWIQRSGDFSYGVGVFAQGGMGVDFRDVMGAPGNDFYSQVSVGRVIFPLAFNVNERLAIGATLEYVWANLDLQYGEGFEFRNSNDFSGEATGDGIAGKVGLVYQVNEQFNVGAAYHSKGNIGDLSGAKGTVGGGTMDANFTFKGFDMPAVLALGMSFQANERLMLGADVKQIQWSNTMKTPVLHMDIGPGFSEVDFRQDWKDQNVLSLGAAYQFSSSLVGRIGANLADNPVPDKNLNPLFPATVKNHYTIGFGYVFNPSQSFDFSLSHAPKTTATSTSEALPPGSKIKHGQTNWQMMYSHRF